jgi:isoquinoline 1-oxidoreductase subunit alpha
MGVLRINGQTHDLDVDPDTSLLWVVRDMLGLGGTRYGCGDGQCSACTVHVDGTAVRSCLVPVSAATGREITTIEGMGSNVELHPVPKTWLAQDVPPCDCHRGVIMAVAALLKTKPKPTDADIDAIITTICRCGTYRRVRAAIHSVAG